MSLSLYITDFHDEQIIDTMRSRETIICDVYFDNDPKDIEKALDKIKKKDILKAIGDHFCSNGMIFFSCVPQLPFFKDNAIEVITHEYEVNDKEQDRFALELPLAPLLGLPNIKPQEELLELAEFISYFREKALAKPSNDLALQLHRGWGERGVDILCRNTEEGLELKQTLRTMMDCATLKAWEHNQMEAIKNTARRCSNLSCTTRLGQLIESDKQLEYFRACNEESGHSLKSINKQLRKSLR